MNVNQNNASIVQFAAFVGTRVHANFQECRYGIPSFVRPLLAFLVGGLDWWLADLKPWCLLRVSGKPPKPPNHRAPNQQLES